MRYDQICVINFIKALRNENYSIEVAEVSTK